MTTTQPEIPPAQKARTIAHMNKDHRRDMRHILVHYAPTTAANSLPQDAADPLMLDITLSAITLRLPDADTTCVLPFEPPLQSWDERRVRLVEMTKAARQALGVTDGEDEDGGKKGEGVEVVVREYSPPRWPYDGVVFMAVLVYYATFALLRLGFFGHGSLLAGLVEMVRFPYGVAGLRWLADAIFVPVLAIHVTETWWLEKSRLRAFGVRRGSRVWWLWVGSVFVEGAMAFKRFDLVVERLRREKAAKGR